MVMVGKHVLAIIITAFTCTSAWSQNIIANTSFENNSGIPTLPAEWALCNGWKSVNNIVPSIYPAGSPDYFHTSGSGTMQLPNTVYGTISPRTGNAIMGITIGQEFLPDNNEYISRQMSSTLTIGTAYEVSFWVGSAVKSGTGDWGMDKLGVHLSVGPLSQTGHELIAVTPQWISSSVIHGSPWQNVTFTFTATTAANWITIGHFDTDANTTFQLFGAPAPILRAVNYFFDDITVKETILLPIELLSFEAKRDEDIVDLSWITGSEINNDYFIIERSADAENWEEIGIVSGAGDSNNDINYSFNDVNPLDIQVSYYRLLQVDYDGLYSHSEIRAATNYEDINTQPVLSYNPLQQNVILDYVSSSEGEVLLHVFDVSGRQMKLFNNPINTGYNSINYPCSGLAKGIYFVQAIIRGEDVTASVAISVY